jgi:hypothetical protein
MAEFVPAVGNKSATDTPVKVYVDIGPMFAQLVVGQRRETAEPAPEQLFRMGNLYVRPDEGNVNGLVAVAAFDTRLILLSHAVTDAVRCRRCCRFCRCCCRRRGSQPAASVPAAARGRISTDRRIEWNDGDRIRSDTSVRATTAVGRHVPAARRCTSGGDRLSPAARSPNSKKSVIKRRR